MCEIKAAIPGYTPNLGLGSYFWSLNANISLFNMEHVYTSDTCIYIFYVEGI